MKRRLFNLVFLSVLLGTGLVPLAIPVDALGGIAWADGGNDQGESSDRGDSHDGEDHGGDSHDGDNGGSGDGGSGDGGSGDGGSGDDGSGDDGSGDGGSGDGGSDAAGGTTSTADRDAGHLFSTDGIHLIYTNGTGERIAQGTYERLDGRGRVIERRAATSADRARLGGLRDGISAAARQSGVQSVITISASRQSVKIVDSAGWTELLQSNRYVLTDPNGNVVTKRAATAKDIARLSAALGLR